MGTVAGQNRRKFSSVAAQSVAVVLLVLNAQAARADEWTSLSVPLRDGRFYSIADFQRQYREKFGGQLTIVDAGREAELTPIERAALFVADEAKLIRVRLEPDRLTLWLPNPENDSVRKRNRRRLESLLGISLSEWPADKGLHLPEKFDATRHTVLLIHGFTGSSKSLGSLALRLRIGRNPGCDVRLPK